MPKSDFKIVEQLFTVSLRDNRNWVSLGLDKREEMTNRFFKIAIKKTPTAPRKLAYIVYRRMLTCGGRGGKEQPFFGEGAGRNTTRALHFKRQSHVTQAYQKLHSSPVLTPAGREVLHALDGRVVSGPQPVTVLSCFNVSQ